MPKTVHKIHSKSELTNSDRFQNEMNNISLIGGRTDEQDNNGGEYEYSVTARMQKRPGTSAEKECVHRKSEVGKVCIMV